MKYRVTTETVEYDDKGNVVKKTRVETEYDYSLAPFVPDPWWTRPAPGWWQNPVISYTTTQDSNTRVVPMN